MQNLNKKEMLQVTGGSITIGLGKITLIVLGVTFVAGIIDGFIRPLKCN